MRPSSFTIAAMTVAALASEVGCESRVPSRADTIAVADALGDSPATGFLRADQPVALSFPADHGPHPGFRTEWWYVTGNLTDDSGRAFGYQLTLFRNQLRAQPLVRSSRWATNQVWMGHLAVTDVAAGTHRATERFARGAAGLAGATSTPLRVWLEDWRLEGDLAEGPASDPADGPFRIRAAASDMGIELDLQLSPTKPMVQHGAAGLSQKGPSPASSSYYYSYTRLRTTGRLAASGRPHRVSGLSWLDHEWSTSVLDKAQVGWNWFSLQLDDGSELMLFEVRGRTGSGGDYRSGTVVQADGTSSLLQGHEYTVTASRWWSSPQTGSRYPVQFEIAVPGHDIELTVESVLDPQELTLTVIYWEGAVRSAGSVAGSPVTGFGYVELTGYHDAGTSRDARH